MAHRTPSPIREGAGSGDPLSSMTTLPPVPPADGAIRRLAGLLDEVGYTAARVRNSLGIESLFLRSFPDPADPPSSGDAPDPVSTLVDLLVLGRPVPRSRVTRALGPEATPVLLAAGVAREAGSVGSELAATLLLYPVGPIRIASDLTPDAPGCLHGRLDALPPDAVYPALAAPNRSFLADLPAERCPGDLLDLCGGTGVAALLSAVGAPADAESGGTRAHRRGRAGVAGRVTSTDLSSRAAAFAALNGALNGVEVEAVAGDLWAPVSGRRFHRILAHPPYLPSLDGDHVFRDGGLDGERLLRRILAGVRAHLAPGGLFHGHGLVVETDGAPAEVRVRRLLEEGGGEGDGVPDLWLVEHEAFTPLEFVLRQVGGGRLEEGAAGRHLEALREGGVRRFVRASVFVQAPERAPGGVEPGRGEAGGGEAGGGEASAGRAPPLQLRRPRGPVPRAGEVDDEGRAELDRFRADSLTLARARASGTLGRLEVRVAPGVRSEVTRLVDGGSPPDGPPDAVALVRLGTLPARVGIPPAALPLLSHLDGGRTPSEALRAARAAGDVPAGVRTADVRQLVEGLLEAGILRPAQRSPNPRPRASGRRG